MTDSTQHTHAAEGTGNTAGAAASSPFYFTSESVSEGHPDKVADQISDAILDALLAQDRHSRVAAETLCGNNLVVLAGEITSAAEVDYEQITRDTIRAIGYESAACGMDYRSCRIMTAFNRQSADIAQGVNEGSGMDMEQGAGDQGLMFGYACDETPTLLPAAIYYSHRLMERQSQLRKDGRLPWLRPDAKAQLSLRYEGGRPVAVDTVVLSTQHDENIEHAALQEAVIEQIIRPVLPAELMQEEVRFFINPTGRFVTGGPEGDAGLTGRKIIVDTYGGSAPHGGGAFSGKDPSKVDRSGAYAARYVAKNIVAAGLAQRCTVQISYAIGIARPTSIMVNTHGTGTVSEEKLIALINRHFDLRPKGIVQMLDLLRPIYSKTAAYGHFGRDEPEFTWEQTDRAAALKADAAQ